jgi:hypothetical protein
MSSWPITAVKGKTARRGAGEEWDGAAVELTGVSKDYGTTKLDYRSLCHSACFCGAGYHGSEECPWGSDGQSERALMECCWVIQQQ